MGDGRVAMILDPNGIVTHTGLSFDELDIERQKREIADERMRLQEQSLNRTLLLFNNAENEVFALPLDEVLRLEKFNFSDIFRIGSRELLNYDGHGLPLLRLENYLPVGSAGKTDEEGYLIIPHHSQGQAGIVATRIIDTVNGAFQPEAGLTKVPGMAGTAIVNGSVTVFLESAGLLRCAGLADLQDGRHT